ncbi:PTS sugar transporter subunit IIC [Calorimonas adulescens]|jgi:PTS system, lactose/cellobiose family IIC component|uniref:Permease IIC component n=1 Tax=Calorimonas adulescens TaxID=2606906 RepID=A0A5D8Q871_9THEO|nr:PTS sugar transporter subunit IIC [Calorimonas adulescens]TZE80965.1 PTS sugar transporter subunit IIC [Calorimonas adulescens]
MDTFINFMDEHFVPVAARIGSQRHLLAIRDGFAAVMPITLAGAFAVLINNTLCVWIPALKFLVPINNAVWAGTFAIMTIFVVFATGYNLAKSYDEDALAAGLISLASFIVTLPQTDGGLKVNYLDATALFTGLIVAIISTEIFVRLTKAHIVINMPGDIPPAVGRAFAALIPGLGSIFLFGIVAAIISASGAGSLYDIILKTIQTPLQNIGQGVGSAMLATFLITLFWFFGLHGANLLDPVMNVVYVPALQANAAAVQAGAHPQFLITRVFFDVFCHLGGSGATLGLLVAIILVAKRRKDLKTLARLALPAGIFQINEPVIFGLPIVLNPILFIPFIIVEPVLTLIAYIATAIGLVPPTYVAIPWTSPVGVGAFLATGGSWTAALVAIINLIVATLIYMPFVMLLDRQKVEEKEEAVSK